MAGIVTGVVAYEIKSKIGNLDCVLAYETAADYLGICDLCSDRPSFTVYSKEELGVDNIECTLVDSFDNIDTIELNGLRCTSINQTIIDLLRDDRDADVIQQAMSYYYESHNQSWDGLEIPNEVKPIFDDYEYDAIHFYDY